MEKKREIILILHNIRSAFNVGSIIRTCDGAGVSRIIASGYTAAPRDCVTPSKPELLVEKPSFGAKAIRERARQFEYRRAISGIYGGGFMKPQPLSDWSLTEHGVLKHAPDHLSVRSDVQILKASLGAEKNVAFDYGRSIGTIIRKVRSAGYQIAALETGAASLSIYNFKPSWPLALIVGNEARGLSPAILKQADVIISLPMYGIKESLNVAVAAGIALYELRRKK